LGGGKLYEGQYGGHGSMRVDTSNGPTVRGWLGQLIGG
jgi:hypothetical protein